MDGFTDASAITQPGIYLLCYRGRVEYVGQTTMLARRISQHKEAWVRKRQGRKGGTTVRAVMFDQVLIQICSIDQLDFLEKQAIVEYQPRYNIRRPEQGMVKQELTLNIRGVELKINALAPPEPKAPVIGLRRI